VLSKGDLRLAPGVAVDDTLWNRAYTSLLRQNKARAWGNWTFDPTVEVGAVGWIDLNTGSFQFLAKMEPEAMTSLASPTNWALASLDVSRSKGNVDFEGGYEDPSSGEKVDVGLDAHWEFSSQGAIAAHGTSGYVTRYQNVIDVLARNFDWLHSIAGGAGHTEGSGISQGFGVITAAWLLDGGLNIGSVSDSAEFSLSGSVYGVTSMSGEGNGKGVLRGSFKSFKEKGTINRQMFPQTPNSVSDTSAAYAFEFASFDDKRILPQWIEEVQPGTVYFANNNGGTYIVDCLCQFDVPGKINRKSETVRVIGGQTGAVSGIPLDAENISVQVEFIGVNQNTTLTLNSEISILTWPSSARTVNIYGVWPWRTDIEWM